LPPSPAEREKGSRPQNRTARLTKFGAHGVETPVNLTRRQQELLREFEGAGEEHATSPESAGFFARVKEFWADLKD